MKIFVAALLVLLASVSYAQITLEHVIPDSNYQFSLIQVDSGEYYYMTKDFGDSTNHQGVDFKLFDLDFNLVKEINVPISLGGIYYEIAFITRNLFDLDNEIEYLYIDRYYGKQMHKIKVIKESGKIIFSCDSCTLSGISNTPRGSKMLIMKHQYIGDPVFPGNQIYSLPGRLPGSNNSSSTTSSAPDITYIESALDIEMAPNPASENIRVSYRLPAGDLSGYITIRDTKGAELQRHAVHFADGSLSLDVRNLSAGSYYCCLLTGDGRTVMRKMMVMR